jgi:hypothetical protein
LIPMGSSLNKRAETSSNKVLYFRLTALRRHLERRVLICTLRGQRSLMGFSKYRSSHFATIYVRAREAVVSDLSGVTPENSDFAGVVRTALSSVDLSEGQIMRRAAATLNPHVLALVSQATRSPHRSSEIDSQGIR